MQGLAKALQRQWLHVILQVGARLAEVGLGEGTKLAGRHGQRPAAPEQVLQAHAQLAPGGGCNAVERLHALDAIDQAQLQVILQVLTDTWQLVPDADAQAFEQRPWADAGTLQQGR